MLGGLGFENAYALAMTRERALELGIRSIARPRAARAALSVAGDYEFFGRPEWKAIREAYGLSFRQRAADAGGVHVPGRGRRRGRRDLRLHQRRPHRRSTTCVVLDDPKQAIPPYDAILLVSPKRADDQAFLAALRPLVGAIDVEPMREANRRASTGATPEAAARWLWERVAATMRK